MRLRPAGLGTLTGIGANNVPLLYDALYTEPDNPKKRAFEEYARELPEAHPRKQEMTQYAAGLGDKNPVREAASKELYDWEKFKERGLMGAGEGVLGGMFGADLVRMPGRVMSFAGRLLGGPASRPNVGATPGGGGGGTPPGGNSPLPTPIAGQGLSLGIPPALPGGGPAQQALPPPIPGLPRPGAGPSNRDYGEALMKYPPANRNVTKAADVETVVNSKTGQKL